MAVRDEQTAVANSWADAARGAGVGLGLLVGIGAEPAEQPAMMAAASVVAATARLARVTLDRE